MTEELEKTIKLLGHLEAALGMIVFEGAGEDYDNSVEETLRSMTGVVAKWINNETKNCWGED